MLKTENWRHQATAFLARCRAQMWGRHKERPLEWLFRAGFSVSFAQDHFLGWNFRSMYRNAALWLGPEREDEKYFLPEGLLLPWIQNEILLRLSILDPEGHIHILEGSSTEAITAGEGLRLIITINDGDAFRLMQENEKGTAIMAAPFLFSTRLPDLDAFGRIRLIAPPVPETMQLLENLRKEGRMAEVFHIPEKGLVAGLLCSDLSPADITAMARF
ncbi:hypothetical protein [Desulfobotulus mexicanus]|uniref:Uncharacterized protein n=1 Tax=Desulfobotulus mexicanus TaxID=2586642 RepID=A0A5S5MDQ8_9BACT|nr:hypothetical protein [Desulfobotulus mexicanus]TYT73843.1 hypothetical protein FIM25_12970 [Desulfobotulus mexicanus]